MLGAGALDISEGGLDVYHPRNPQASDYYRCVEGHFEELEMVWEDRYERIYGFWRPYVMDVIYRYLGGTIGGLLGTIGDVLNI